MAGHELTPLEREVYGELLRREISQCDALVDLGLQAVTIPSLGASDALDMLVDALFEQGLIKTFAAKKQQWQRNPEKFNRKAISWHRKQALEWARHWHPMIEGYYFILQRDIPAHLKPKR